MSRTVHICVPIERALQELAKGNNLLKCDDLQAFRILMEHKERGREYYTGCDNEDVSGRCAGHETEDNTQENKEKDVVLEQASEVFSWWGHIVNK